MGGTSYSEHRRPRKTKIRSINYGRAKIWGITAKLKITLVSANQGGK